MFRISRAEEQSLRLTMRLAAVGSQQTLGELADAEDLPEPTVAKLLGLMKRGGVVDATRGRHGGYFLAEPPCKISAAEIIRCVTAKSAFEYPCQRSERSENCARVKNCGLRPVWRLLEKKFFQILEQTTLEDMLQKESVVAEKLKEIWLEKI